MASPVQSLLSPQYLPGSTGRKMREFFGIFQTAFRALQSYFMRVSSTVALATLRGRCAPKNGNREAVAAAEKAQQVFQAVQQLKSGGCLNGTTLTAYGESLETKAPNFQFFNAYCMIFPVVAEKLPSLPSLRPGKDLLAIPIVVKGTFRDHVLITVVDTVHWRIEFYDPKGLTIADRAQERLSCCSQTLGDLMGEICKAYPGYSVVENTARHQGDGYNCGVYVSDYMARRCAGQSFEDIAKKGLSFTEASGSKRSEMISALAR